MSSPVQIGAASGAAPAAHADAPWQSPGTGGALGPSLWHVTGAAGPGTTYSFSVASALREMSRWMRLAHIRSQTSKSEPFGVTTAGLMARAFARLAGNALPVLSEASRSSLAPPFPTVLFAAGEPANAALEHVHRASQGTTCGVWFGPAARAPNAELVLDPAQLVAEPVFFAPETVEQAEQDWLALGEEGGLRVHVRVSGLNWDEQACDAFIADLMTASRSGARLWISTRQQTPPAVRERLRQFAERRGAWMWESVAVDGPNPTLGRFLFAHLAILADDDARSQSEAAYFGVPILLAGRRSEPAPTAVALLESGRARPFGAELTPWRVDPLREVDGAADRLVARLLQRYPSARF